MTIEESRPIGSYIGQLETFSPCPKSLAEFRSESSYIRVDNTKGKVISQFIVVNLVNPSICEFEENYHNS